MAISEAEERPARRKPAAPRNGRPRATTLEELRERRTLWATLPSGAVVRIRPPNMEMHALSGGLPQHLRHLTTESVTGAELNRRLRQNPDELDEREEKANLALRDYLVEIVHKMIVEPDLAGITTFEELDGLLLPVDWHWLMQVGARETDYDGEGKRLWGIEPVSRWATFREFHGCDEDCQACAELRRSRSVAEV